MLRWEFTGVGPQGCPLMSPLAGLTTLGPLSTGGYDAELHDTISVNMTDS